MHPQFKNLVEIVATLRAEGGCPWDREQTIHTMAPKILEEGQEVMEALEKEDWENLEEELGDVLLNVLMIAQIASEEKNFDINTILEKVAQKLKSRHTWVFGEEKAATAEEALALWNKNKRSEKTAAQAKASNKKTS